MRLLSTLREEGFGAAGTVQTMKTKTELTAEQPLDQSQLERTQSTQQQSQKKPREVNRGLDPSLAELKINHNNQIP